MTIIDKALIERHHANRPIRVAMVGAGFMGRGIANQIINYVPGMELVAIANRTIEKARTAYFEAGVESVEVVTNGSDLDSALRRDCYAITDDASLVSQAESIDAVIGVTGAVEFGARFVMEAIKNGKHIILMNAELDATIGPILKVYADRAGVIYTACDGDQPGVQMNLYRFVKSIGLTPLVCGNIKGLQDPYRTPTTQAGFAKKWGQNPSMVTSFADGTKISFEQAIVANGTGMRVAQRGMLGYEFTGHVDELTTVYDVAELRSLGGIVDYVVGAKPSPGVFVLATHDDPKQRHYLNLYKLGDNPLYSFYRPYHLCHFEVPLSVARAVIFKDALLAPMGGPQVEVVAIAKRDLKVGETLDGLGHYMTYGECENSDTARSQNLLPIGLAENATLLRDIAKDQVISFDDVQLPTGRLCDSLWREQNEYFQHTVSNDRETLPV